MINDFMVLHLSVCCIDTNVYSGDAGKSALETNSSVAANSSGGIERKSTRLWAEEIGYNTSKLFNKACFVNVF